MWRTPGVGRARNAQWEMWGAGSARITGGAEGEGGGGIVVEPTTPRYCTCKHHIALRSMDCRPRNELGKAKIYRVLDSIDLLKEIWQR